MKGVAGAGPEAVQGVKSAGTVLQLAPLAEGPGMGGLEKTSSMWHNALFNGPEKAKACEYPDSFSYICRV